MSEHELEDDRPRRRQLTCLASGSVRTPAAQMMVPAAMRRSRSLSRTTTPVASVARAPNIHEGAATSNRPSACHCPRELRTAVSRQACSIACTCASRAVIARWAVSRTDSTGQPRFQARNNRSASWEVLAACHI
jgi:hypothetical protein